MYIFLALQMTSFCMDEKNPSEIEYLTQPFTKIIRRPVPNVVEMDIGNYRYLVCEVTRIIINKCPVTRHETKN